ncbi:MAG TPA: ribonuclease E/G, partial [Candidatus Sulfopaludibacter sp.]|nr:ribonuclease E/G [Candidatus Sulfopaludibacter sp.]
MSKELVISATPHETRVAIMEDGQLCEIYIEREKEFALVGSLYKGRVTRVLPGMQSAFVDIGLDSDAFLYVSDFLEHLEGYDHVAAPVEVRPRMAEPQPAEVYPPTTINGGAIAAPAPTPEPLAAVEAAPAITPLEGETIQAIAAGQTNATESGVPPAAPVQRSQRPFESRPFEQRNDRGRGGFGDRGGRGGRNRRWGGRPGRGGRDRRPGRDLPPSKYAPPMGSRPRENAPYEPAAMDFEPVILPGESLAKYKDRIPSAPSAPAAAGSALGTEAAAAPQAASRTFTDEELAAGLPGSLYAVPPAARQESETMVTEGEIKILDNQREYAAPSAAAETGIAHSAKEAEPESAHAEIAETHPANGGSLSDEEVSALAEQLAEAKHEEAQAEAEDHSEAIEAVAESYVEPAELEDLQEALDTDQDNDQEADQEDDQEDEHEAAAEEADAIAEEMHEEAMGAEASAEHGAEQGEGHAPEHTEGHAGELGEEHAEVHEEAHEEFHEARGEAAEPPHAGEEQPPTSVRISEPPRARFQRPMRRGGRPQRGRRGGRPYPQQHHGHGPRHEQNRRPQLISEMLKAGEEIIVQIAKEPLGKKGARITSHVALPGRFLVYMPTVDHIGVSRRIGSAEDRSRLRRVVTEAKGTFPGGFIVRTAASGASDEEIRADVEFLGQTWDKIRATSEQRRAPSLLHRDLNLVERILRDYLSDDYAAIWLDSEEEFTKVVEFVGRFQPKMVP